MVRDKPDVGGDTLTVAVAVAAVLLAQVIVVWLPAAAPGAIDPVAVEPLQLMTGAGKAVGLLELQNDKTPFCALRA